MFFTRPRSSFSPLPDPALGGRRSNGSGTTLRGECNIFPTWRMTGGVRRHLNAHTLSLNVTLRSIPFPAEGRVSGSERAAVYPSVVAPPPRSPSTVGTLWSYKGGKSLSSEGLLLCQLCQAAVTATDDLLTGRTNSNNNNVPTIYNSVKLASGTFTARLPNAAL